MNTGAVDPLGAIADIASGTAPGCTSTARSGCGRRRARTRRPLARRRRARGLVGDATATSGSTSPTTAASRSSRTARRTAAAHGHRRELPRSRPRTPRCAIPSTGTRSSRAARAACRSTPALRQLGRSGVAELVDRLCACSERFAERLASVPGIEVLAQGLNQTLLGFDPVHDVDEVRRGARPDGTCLMTATTWRGRRCLRISCCNWKTTTPTWTGRWPRCGRRRLYGVNFTVMHVAVAHHVVAALQAQRAAVARARVAAGVDELVPADRPRRARSPSGCRCGSRRPRARRSGRAQVPALRRLVLAGGEERDQVEQREGAATTRSQARLADARGPRASRARPRRRARTARPRGARRPRRRRAPCAAACSATAGGHLVVALVDVGDEQHRLGRQRLQQLRGASGASSGTGTVRAGRPACSASMTSRSQPPRRSACLSPPRACARRARGGARPARGRRRSARSRSCRCRARGSTLPSGWMTFVVAVGADDVDDARRSRGCSPGTGCPGPRPCGAAHEAGDVVEVDRVPDDLRGADVSATLLQALVDDRHDRDVRLDRRERVVRRLGARLGQRVEQRGLARVGHPDDADLHGAPRWDDAVAFAVRPVPHVTYGVSSDAEPGPAPATRRRTAPVVRSVRATQARTFFLGRFVVRGDCDPAATGRAERFAPFAFSRARSPRVLVVLGAHVDDLGEVEPHGPVLVLDLVPAAAGRARPSAPWRPSRSAAARAPRRPGSRGSRRALVLGVLRHVSGASAGSTISVSTPPVLGGWQNATREPRMPVRGVSSISRTPAAAQALERRRRCRPPGRRRGACPAPRLARNLPTGVSAPSGCEQLDVVLADVEQHGLDALLLDDLAVHERPSRRRPRRARARRRWPRRRRRCGRCGRTCRAAVYDGGRRRGIARRDDAQARQARPAVDARHALHDAVDLGALERPRSRAARAANSSSLARWEVIRSLACAVRLEGQLLLLLVADAAREVRELAGSIDARLRRVRRCPWRSRGPSRG